MNERIKELMEEAETKEIGYYFFDREKFAELIVQECVGVCNGRHHTWRWDDEDDSLSGPRDCANSIKRHFGVEE
jgi:hypothetical protein